MAELMVDAGDVVRLATTEPFTNADDDPTNPTATRLRIRPPWPAAEIVYTAGVDGALVNDGPGAYHADVRPVDLLADPQGRWRYAFEGEGAVTAGEEGTFFVRYSRFAEAAP